MAKAADQTETAAAASAPEAGSELPQNKNGLVPLKLNKPYGKFNAGETAGFRPAEAVELLKTGDCELVVKKK